MALRRRGATPGELEAIYRERFKHFARVAAAVAGDGELGRDVVQNAFTIALRQRRQFRGEGPLDHWIWRIVVNEARRLARQPRNEQLGTADEAASNGSGADPLGIHAWIAVLPER